MLGHITQAAADPPHGGHHRAYAQAGQQVVETAKISARQGPDDQPQANQQGQSQSSNARRQAERTGYPVWQGSVAGEFERNPVYRGHAKHGGNAFECGKSGDAHHSKNHD